MDAIETMTPFPKKQICRTQISKLPNWDIENQTVVTHARVKEYGHRYPYIYLHKTTYKHLPMLYTNSKNPSKHQ